MNGVAWVMKQSLVGIRNWHRAISYGQKTGKLLFSYDFAESSPNQYNGRSYARFIGKYPIGLKDFLPQTRDFLNWIGFIICNGTYKGWKDTSPVQRFKKTPLLYLVSLDSIKYEVSEYFNPPKDIESAEDIQPLIEPTAEQIEEYMSLKFVQIGDTGMYFDQEDPRRVLVDESLEGFEFDLPDGWSSSASTRIFWHWLNQLDLANMLLIEQEDVGGYSRSEMFIGQAIANFKKEFKQKEHENG
jgi:hypothetical protein